MRRKVFTLLAMTWLALVGLSSCGSSGSEPEERRVPYAPVSLQLNLNGEAHHLRNPFSLLLIEHPRQEGERVGNVGVVVVHGYQLGDPTNPVGAGYYAYDLACPVELPTLVATQPIKEGDEVLLATKCPVCQTVYDLSMGTGHPISGEGRWPLQNYAVRMLGNDLLLISH